MSATGAPEVPGNALKRVYKRAEAAGTVDDFTLKHVRRALDGDEGWTCSDAEWKQVRTQVKAEWAELLGADESASPSPQKKKQRNGQRSGKGSTSDKYGRAAEKNLKVFMGALGGVLGGLTAGADGSDAEGEEDGRADDAPSPSGSASSSSRAPAAKKAPKKRKTVVTIASSDQEDDAPAPPQPQPPQKRSRKQANPQRRVASDRIADEVLVGPASAAQTGAPPIASTSKAGVDVPINMNDSDLSELEDNGPLPGARSRKGKGKAVESKSKKEKSAATSKSKKSDKKAKERKAPALKPGDAPRGTDAEEDRITKLKALLSAAASPRPFTATTGAERTLAVSRRKEILEGLLKDLGLPVKGDKLLTLARAKDIGEKRLLAKEMAELGGTAHHTGLRTGKELHHDSSLDDDDESSGTASGPGISASAKKKQVLAERKKFGAFLGDQSSDDAD
ncbi:hypothetical protein BMF94_6973 [Rhodotorula taiwanensis]|uniref:Uncharacterized protein n=1 Tax=Rhodotorula taiwanensis TaxID=741276 RepID=A0A2S5AZT3_9BASI|nr:hypothetical protein BMF94_6973 [Rhodotorula taiwanensis]